MKRKWWIAIVAAALPSLASAVEPLLSGRVTGMSELPAHAQDSITREAQRTGTEIRELRVEPDGTFRAELMHGTGGELLSLDHSGAITGRQKLHD
jgi:hypothetical protein